MLRILPPWPQGSTAESDAGRCVRRARSWSLARWSGTGVKFDGWPFPNGGLRSVVSPGSQPTAAVVGPCRSAVLLMLRHGEPTVPAPSAYTSNSLSTLWLSIVRHQRPPEFTSGDDDHDAYFGITRSMATSDGDLPDTGLSLRSLLMTGPAIWLCTPPPDIACTSRSWPRICSTEYRYDW